VTGSINETMICLLGAMEAKDRSLLEHSIYTARIAQSVANILISDGFRQTLPTIDEIITTGLLHDIGKLKVPDSIFHKASGLTNRETENIRFHPLWGEQFLSRIPSLKHLSIYIYQHHELPDGGGYPLGLKTKDIHPASRVINISDRFSALTTDRHYRKAIDHRSALLFLEENIEVFFGKRNKKSITQCLMSMQNIRYILDEQTHPLIKSVLERNAPAGINKKRAKDAV